MDFFTKNSSFFEQQFPLYREIINKTTVSNFKISETENGFSLLLKTAEREIALSSKINPRQEAVKIIQNHNLNADHFILLGLANFYLVEQLIKFMPRKAKLLIIEPSFEIIKLSFYALDWEEIFKKQILLVPFNDISIISEVLYQFLDFTLFKNIEFIENPAETRLLAHSFQNLRQKIEDEIKTILYNLQTLMAEGEMVVGNILKNIKLSAKTIPVKSLFKSYKNFPAIIVAAGPSLDRNILYLKKITDRALLIAVDTALKPLLAHGIQPHFTVAADPSYKNWLHFLGTENRVENYIVAELGVCNQIFKDFQKQIITATIGRDLEEIIEKNFIEFGELPAWGSVISFALSFAIYLGTNPIVFCGLDFAYSDERNHCRNSWWEENFLLSTTGKINLQEFERLTITGNRKVFAVKDIFQAETFTSDRLFLYKNYFLNYLTKFSEINFFNASEGGILKEIPQITMAAFIKKFLSERKKIPALSTRIRKQPSITKKDIQRIRNFFKLKTEFFEQYAKKIESVLVSIPETTSGIKIDRLYQDYYRLKALKDELYQDISDGILLERWQSTPILHLLKKEEEIKTKPASDMSEELSSLIALYCHYFRNLLQQIGRLNKLIKQII